MGIMDIFGGGSPASSSSTTKLPDYLKDQYQKQWGREDELWDMGKGVVGGMDPREILGLNPWEKMGFQEAMGGFDRGEDFLQAGSDFGGYDSALGGLGSMLGKWQNFDTAGGYQDLAGQDRYGRVEGMDDYWNLGQDAGSEYDALMGMGGDLNGDPLRDWETNRIGDKTLDEMRESYENDYTDKVVDTTLGSADRQRDRDRMAEQMKAGAAGGAQGTRSAIADAVGQSEYGLNRANLENQMRSQAFDTAAKFGQSEAQLGQNEDQMNYDALNDSLNFDKGMFDSFGNLLGDKYTHQGNIMGDYLDKDMAWKDKGAQWDKGLYDSMLDREETKMKEEGSTWDDLLSGEKDRMGMNQDLSKMWSSLGSSKGGLMSMFGENMRGLDQAQMDADRTHGMDMTNWLSGMLGGFQGQGMPSGVGTTNGTQQEATPGLGQTLLGLGTAWLSDEDAKEGIVDADDGALDAVLSLGVKEYGYKDGMPGHRNDRHVGLIAQDLERKVPHSTFKGQDGLRRVDPFAVTATIVKAVQELDAKSSPHKRWNKAA